MKRILYFLPVLLFTGYAIYGLTPPPSLEELVSTSDYIALSKLTNIKEQKLSKDTVSVSLNSEILKVYKAKGELLPKKLTLGFIIFPEYFGKWLRSAPAEGEYIIFYINKKVTDKNEDRTGYVISLYEPHPYAFREWNKELEDKIISLAK